MAANDKPKLLHINTVADQCNSVGAIMGSIVSRAKAAGFDARIGAGRGDVSSVDFPIGSVMSVMAHVAASRMNDCEGWWSKRATVEFLKAVDEWGPDIVHLHNVHGHYINIPTLFDWLETRKLPVVLTLHDCWWLTGHCSFYSHLDCSPLDGCVDCRHHGDEYPISFRSRSVRNFRLKHELLNRRGLKLNIVVPSRWTADRLNDSGLGHHLVSVIPHGIEIDEFSSCHMDESHEMVLAVAARWEKRKNLEAVNNLAESGLCKAPIMVVGHLMGQTLHENITYHPQIDSRDHLVGLYSKASVLLNPSISETFGLTALEAMAAGTPVVVNADSAINEIVTPECGIATDVNDTINLAKIVNEIMVKRDEFNPKAVAARYTSTLMSEKYMDLYRSLIG